MRPEPLSARALKAAAGLNVPPPLTRFLFRLPQFPPSLALATALNLALGESGLAAIPPDLTGRQVRLVVTDLGMELALLLTAKGFVPPHLPSATPEVTIRAGKADFLAMASRTEDSDTLFFSRRLVMEGDTALGLLVRNLLDSVDLAALGAREFSPWRVAGMVGGLLKGRKGERWVVW
ncbi:MAG TPA: SCP2 sterol-binding domain-containing protein [Fluviicoccus sp.]|nr:SCP2 sterol-binding domain-containing protein [Fluviicoccus sp.]